MWSNIQIVHKANRKNEIRQWEFELKEISITSFFVVVVIIIWTVNGRKYKIIDAIEMKSSFPYFSPHNITLLARFYCHLNETLSAAHIHGHSMHSGYMNGQKPTPSM